MSEFVREPRYLVIKIKDAVKYLSEAQCFALTTLAARVEKGRSGDGKPALDSVVVERDWPEFEPTWAAIEARMKSSNRT